MLLLCSFIYSTLVIAKSYIIVSEVKSNQFVTENTSIIGNLRFDFIQLNQMFSLENILSVEEDSIVSVDDFKLQKNPIWNLDRLDQRSNDIDSMYFYQNKGGSSVTNYVLDTGVFVDHPELEGRAKWGLNVADGENQTGCMHPHGTHVAGTIGSKTYGVAKNTSIVSVKVLGCNGSGSVSGILKAIEWVTKQKEKKKVINMSLGGGFSQALNLAVEQATKLGILVVVAAGNENKDACSGSPSSSPHAITVGALNKMSQLAYFSNWGKCVDVFAPGVSILSTVKGGTAYMDGTSMASPHVAGVATLIWDEVDTIDPVKIKNFMKFSATQNKISGDLKNSVNAISYSLASILDSRA